MAKDKVMLEGIEMEVSVLNTDPGSGNAAKHLRSRLRKKQRVADGTVVRFNVGAYTYAALWVAGAWWISGTNPRGLGGKMTDDEFTDTLASCTSAAVATSWELVK